MPEFFTGRCHLLVCCMQFFVCPGKLMFRYLSCGYIVYCPFPREDFPFVVPDTCCVDGDPDRVAVPVADLSFIVPDLSVFFQEFSYFFPVLWMYIELVPDIIDYRHHLFRGLVPGNPGKSRIHIEILSFRACPVDTKDGIVKQAAVLGLALP